MGQYICKEKRRGDFMSNIFGKRYMDYYHFGEFVGSGFVSDKTVPNGNASYVENCEMCRESEQIRE